ncbi:hypothetical protein [Arthrobacter cryoconiti]|uniref:Uncharacterized protein n=1 Tax=Arthrobacter cryoconiti TaxID=748907 RepID=A0ABV8R0L1_9MICC|nr:hypothetical protein [Arthrobacter cryoconiti]MCC9068597.1 hypothetical protein [Arthrobacter cryoconiti]
MLIRQDNGRWREPKAAGYAPGSELQDLLAVHAELIPGASPVARTCREFQTEAGPADIVVVDVTGEVTLVGSTLASNPQIRREIVGQMFDYTSCLWEMDVDDFASGSRNRTTKPLFADEDDEGVVINDALAQNLKGRNFRIVLVSDAINPALKRVAEYLNAVAGQRTMVVAIEHVGLRQDNVEILMVLVHGQEQAEARSSPDRRELTLWDTESFRSWLAEHDGRSIDGFDALLAKARAQRFTF